MIFESLILGVAKLSSKAQNWWELDQAYKLSFIEKKKEERYKDGSDVAIGVYYGVASFLSWSKSM